MSSDFSEVCKLARAGISVPAVPLEAIKAGRPAQRVAPRRLRAAVLAFGFTLAAAAGGAAVWQGAQVKLTPGGGLVLKADTMHMAFNPSDRAVQNAAQNANFAVTLPSGLPQGTHLIKMGTSAGLIVLTYDLPGSWRASHHLLNVVLLNAKTTRLNDTPGIAPMMLQLRASRARAYQTGDEVVIVQWNSLTPAELARVVAAMHLR